VLALEKHGFLRWMVVNVIPDECRKAGAVVKEEIDDDRLSVQPVVTPTVKVRV
jgi:hypothetical protein